MKRTACVVWAAVFCFGCGEKHKDLNVPGEKSRGEGEVEAAVAQRKDSPKRFIAANLAGHMLSGYPSNLRLFVACSQNGYSNSDVLQMLKNDLLAYDRKLRSPVSFNVVSPPATKTVGSCDCYLEFHGLGQGDYVVEKGRSGAITLARQKTVFHVGALLRVASVRYGRSSGSPGLVDRVSIYFSEFVKKNTLSGATSIVRNDTGVTLAVSEEMASGSDTAGVELKLTAAVPDAVRLTIAIPVTVESSGGLKLDGQFKGQPGSGDFVLTVQPSAVKNGEWNWQ